MLLCDVGRSLELLCGTYRLLIIPIIIDPHMCNSYIHVCSTYDPKCVVYHLKQFIVELMLSEGKHKQFGCGGGDIVTCTTCHSELV